MRIAVTGATGLVGHPIAAHLAARGHAVTGLGRRPLALPGVGHQDYHLGGPLPDLTGVEALVHAAFSHVPGRYRGGEGDDPEGFRRLNRDESLRLFAHARSCGVSRIVFLSSRAVYDGYPAGTILHDDLPARPDSLYGHVKAEVEEVLTALASDSLTVASLRATGVYGPPVPGRPHKWSDLFSAYERGDAVAPRVATEVHSDDLAAAVALLLTADPAALGGTTFNASDILLDQRDLLAIWAEVTGRGGPLPPPADPTRVSVMTTARLSALGWVPRGLPGLRQTLQGLWSDRQTIPTSRQEFSPPGPPS